MISRIRFAELPVEDQDRAVEFYTEKLGLEVAVEAPYDNEWRWIELAIPGAETRLLLSRKADLPRPRDRPVLVLDVGNVDAEHEKLVERGVSFDQEPRPAPWDPSSRFALFRDSEDNLIMIG